MTPKGDQVKFFLRQVLKFFQACKWILTPSTCDDRQDPKYATLKCKQRREWTKYYEGFMRKRLAWDDQAQLLSSEFFECINNFRVHKIFECINNFLSVLRSRRS